MSKLVVSAPQGETAMLSSLIVISRAYSNESGFEVVDLATGATRFNVSDDGIVVGTESRVLERVVSISRPTPGCEIPPEEPEPGPPAPRNHRLRLSRMSMV